ncbi:tetratricopeptide repeat protein [Nonomuraea sp. SYSU D8015]|uniref:tetratricopeptide repeat protein n=1 Tax=Nonomuraea sp. SYSU D8015 TaxID=2593644 RepID=UPI001661191F|nr:tetratricopeptide repeat protein [Nonomuraea sp. SYSU D8015]
MASEQLDAAMSCWKEGELDRAAALFREIAATGDPEASHLLAGLLQEQGDLDGAEAAHRSVIQSGDPVFGQRSAMAMGMMLVQAKEWPAAHRVLTIASDGADFEVAALADTALVLVCTQLGDAQGAEEALERARRCDSPSVAELAARLELPEFHQDPASARDLYLAAEDEDDFRELLTCGDPDVVSRSAFRLYQRYAEEEDFESAREMCEHAIAVGHPDHLAMAHKLLGAVLVDLGEYAESAAAYRVAAEDPRPEIRLPSLIELAKVTAQLGDDDETKAIFHRVIASGQREYVVQAQACLAQMHTEAGETAEALAALRAVLEAGESEWASVCVTLLGLLLDQRPEAYDEVIELVRLAAGHDDPDAAFKARLLLDHDDRRQPLADPVEEQALQDVDAALDRVRAGDLAEARRLLRRAADSGAATQAIRAMVALAELELGEGDREQADELLAYVAEGDDVVQGFAATFLLHLLRISGADLHPVLRAVVEHQRLGREEGLARYHETANHPDPAVAAVGTAVFAQVMASFGYTLSETSRLLHDAAGSGEPLALSYAAALSKELLPDRDEAVALLRRARAEGHPVLAPWVGYLLGGLLEDDEPAEARSAYATALDSAHQGLRNEAAGSLAALYEEQGDLPAACRLHERRIARESGEEAARSAWLLGLTRVRLDDLAAARSAFEAATGGPTAMGRFARALLDRDFDGAAAALTDVPGDGNALLTSMLAMETAHAWQRRGETAAADAALSLVADAGHPGFRQEAACYLGALRNEAGDKEGAIDAWARAAEGENERLAAVALGHLGYVRQELGRLAEAADAYRRVLAAGEPDGDEPRRTDATVRLAEALVASGEVEEARALLSEAFGAEARLFLAGMLRDHGDLPAALSTLTDAGSRLPAAVWAALGGLGQGAQTGQGTRSGTVPGIGGRAEPGEHSAAGVALPGEPADLEREPGSAEAALIGRSGAVGVTPLDEPRQAGERLEGSMGGAEGEVAAAEATLLDVPGGAAARPEGVAWRVDGMSAAEARLLGELLVATGDVARAKAAFERAVAAGPESAGSTLVTAARLIGEAGDEEYARAAYERAAAQDDDRWAAAVARVRLGTGSAEERGWVLAADGDRAGAVAALAEVVGSAALAELVLALDRGDVTESRRLLATLTGDDRRDGLIQTLRTAGGLDDETAARRLLRLVIELGDPELAAEAYLSLGTSWADDGEPGRAELCFLPATEHPATAHAAWHNLAIVRERRGDLDGAVDALRAGMPRTAVALAEALDGRGDTAGVRQALADGAADGDLECLRLLVGHLVREQEHEAAAEAAERAVASGDPQTVVMGYWGWGDARQGVGDLAGAAEMYRKGIDSGYQPLVAGLRTNLAKVLHGMDDPAGAYEQAAAAAAAGDPEAAAIGHLMIGCWRHDEGDVLGAAEAFAAAVATGAEPATEALGNLRALACQEFERGAHDVAVRVLDLMGEPGAEVARELAVECADPAAVRVYFRRAGDGPFTELGVADRLAALGERAEARAILERLTEHDDPEVRFVAGGRLLELLDGEGDDDAFYDIARRQAADADSPVRGVFGSLLGMLQDNRGDTTESLRTLREAAAGGEPIALSTLAQTLVGAGQVDEGRETYLKVLDAGDAGLAARAMVALGQTYHDEDEERAREWYVRAVEAAEGHTGALAAMYLGALAKRNRDFPEALTWYQRVIDAGDSESGMAAAHLGELCYWLGDRDGALRYYELTLGLTEQADLVAEAACRLGEIRYERGDLAVARRLLRTAAGTGDPSFAPQAEILLAKLS